MKLEEERNKQMRNAVCILANNMEYFNLFVQNYPEELRTDDCKLIVVNETRIGEKTKEIKRKHIIL